jgi:glycosyltransferase involved in cell wall biosynthesis
VHLEPAVNNKEALAEILQAVGLLLFQGYTSSPAIPAKLYEYLRAGRPIIALNDELGSTSGWLERCDGIVKASTEDSEAISDAIADWLKKGRADSDTKHTNLNLASYSHRNLAGNLADLLNAVS